LAADEGGIDFVRILQFKSFADLAHQAALAQATMPPLTDLNPAVAAPVAVPAVPKPSTAARPVQPQ
jgi:rod shape-determining protein MreC